MSCLPVTVPVHSALLAKNLKTPPFAVGLDDAFCGRPTPLGSASECHSEIALHVMPSCRRQAGMWGQFYLLPVQQGRASGLIHEASLPGRLGRWRQW